MEDKRRFPRIQFGFRVEDPNGKKVWMTEDISSGGCFLRALEKMPVGSKIDLVFQLPGSSKYIKAVGEVRHIRDKGMGVEFVTIDPESKKETERFVEDYVKYEEKSKGS